MNHIETAKQIIKQELNSNIKKISQLGGGSINSVFLVELEKSRIVLKINDSLKFPGMFENEKKGLLKLNKSGVKTPQVIFEIAKGNLAFLALEYIPNGNFENWELFGEKLAVLHMNKHEFFGLDYDNYIGSLRQINKKENNWKGFYSNQRLLHLTKFAFNKKLISKTDSKKMEELCLKLNTYIPFTEPSLIHGDLWSGNLIFDEQGKPVFIDPAIYYGHPEMDWAMLSLFGSYPEKAMKSYCNYIPLESNYFEREKIYQLYPLLVHLILFGRSYYRDITEILNFYS
jgi:fructosamine-3-kinase